MPERKTVILKVIIWKYNRVKSNYNAIWKEQWTLLWVTCSSNCAHIFPYSQIFTSKKTLYILTHIFYCSDSVLLLLSCLYWIAETNHSFSTLLWQPFKLLAWFPLATGNLVQYVNHCFGSETRMCFSKLVLNSGTLAWPAMSDKCLLTFLKQRVVFLLDCTSRMT